MAGGYAAVNGFMLTVLSTHL